VEHRDTSLTEPGHRRVGGLWLLVDEQGRVLLVQPSDKGGLWHLVGGGALPGEQPHVAAAREGWEEIGLTMVPDTCVLTDYSPPNPNKAETLSFVFYHRLTKAELDSITLNAGTPEGEDPELLAYRLFEDHELDEHCAPYIARRVREAMAAVADPALRGYRAEGRRIAYAE
jgi:8-oxo-dGTP pyrophosphatase MutT (NUDIX family)